MPTLSSDREGLWFFLKICVHLRLNYPFQAERSDIQKRYVVSGSMGFVVLPIKQQEIYCYQQETEYEHKT